jgi:hypothetical protein
VYWIGPAAAKAIASGMATNIPGLEKNVIRQRQDGKGDKTEKGKIKVGEDKGDRRIYWGRKRGHQDGKGDITDFGKLEKW